MSNFFMEGGWSMYPIACFGLMGVLASLACIGVLFASSRKLPLGFGAATLLLGLSTVALGGLGFAMGMRAVDGAVANADPESREMMRAQGIDEADNNLYFAAGASLLPLACGALAILRGATMKSTDKA